MIVLLANYTVKPGQEAAVVRALDLMIQAVKADEPGCILYQLSRSNQDPRLFMLYELYEDEAAVAHHRETGHFQTYILDTVVPLLDKREVAQYTLLIQ